LLPNPRLELSLAGASPDHASRLALLLSEAAAICWFTAAARNTSRRKRTDAVSLRQLAEAMPQIVWTANAEGRTTYLSPQWSRYTGLPAEPAHDPQFLA